MSIESINNGISNLDALNDVTLDSIHNPQEPNTNVPNPTGDDDKNPKPNKDGEEEGDKNKVTPPATPPVQNNNGDNNDGNPNDIINDFVPIKSFDDLVNLLTTKTSETLTDTENEQLADLVESFGGEALNKDGAIVDAEGKILYSPEQVKHFITNDELPVDDKGNLVNANGDIVKTKVELFRETTTVGTVMNSLAKNFGVAYADDYMPEDTEDSIIDVVNKVAKVVEARSVANYFKTNPELEAYRKHLQLHGSAEGFQGNTVDYDNVDIKDLTIEKKKAYIAEAFKAVGKTLTPAYSKYLESLGEEEINLEVQDNLKVLKTQQDNAKQQVDNALKQKQQQQEAEAKQYWNDVTTTVKNGKLSNINIPLPEREAFLTYLMTPVQNGRSQDMIDADNDTVESDLLMSYLRYKGRDISALAKNIATTQAVAGLRERMQNNKRRNTSSDKGAKPKTQDNYIPSLGEVNF